MGRKRVLEDKSCEQCGREFRPRLRVDKYCSPACRSAARSRPKKVCLQCRAEFQPATGEQKFCSHACSSASQRADRSIECQWCKSVFERPHGKARAYCSRSCSMKARGAGLAANYMGLSPKQEPGDGYHLTSSGYRARKVNGIQVFEHREVMEEIIGRPLMPP